MEEKVDLKNENIHLKTVVDEVKTEYNVFRVCPFSLNQDYYSKYPHLIIGGHSL